MRYKLLLGGAILLGLVGGMLRVYLSIPKLSSGAPNSTYHRNILPFSHGLYDVGTSSNAFNQIFATATSSAGLFQATSTTASSTFANGLNLTGGCFAIGGTCLSTGGITSLNGLTGATQTFASSSSALNNDVAIVSSGTTHTFRWPDASGTVRGFLSSSDWTTFNNKQASLGSLTGLVASNGTVTYAAATSTISFGYASTTQIGSTESAYFATASGNVGIGTTTTGVLLDVFSTGTSTIRLDSNSTSKGGCIEIKDKSGIGYTYLYAEDGVLYSDTVSCK